jgi:hypothetical protein
LKADDLRRQLIEHGEDPASLMRASEFAFVKAGALFAPADTFGYQPCLRDEVLLDPDGCVVTLNIGSTMLNVNLPWAAVQTEASPVPEFEGEDVGSCAPKVLPV